MRWPPTFGGPSSAQDPGGDLDTFPELNKGQSPEPNSTGPNWARAKGIDSLRPTTVLFGTDLGPTGPGQGVRRKGGAFQAPETNCVFSVAFAILQLADGNRLLVRQLHDH